MTPDPAGYRAATLEDEERAFLAAVLRSPLEDLPRLAYADWLDEHEGGWPCPRADEIRRQCAERGRWFSSAEVDPDRRFGLAAGVRTDSVWWGRGFPGLVAATLYDLFGGPCRQYQGPAPYDRRDPHAGCVRCGGTGTEPGLAAGWFKVMPLTDVAVAGLVPRELHFTGPGGGRIWSYHGVRDPDGTPLPPELNREMLALWNPGNPGAAAPAFRSAAAARTCLGMAAVNWGRTLPGVDLGPLYGHRDLMDAVRGVK